MIGAFAEGQDLQLARLGIESHNLKIHGDGIADGNINPSKRHHSQLFIRQLGHRHSFTMVNVPKTRGWSPSSIIPQGIYPLRHLGNANSLQHRSHLLQVCVSQSTSSYSVPEPRSRQITPDGVTTPYSLFTSWELGLRGQPLTVGS